MTPARRTPIADDTFEMAAKIMRAIGHPLRLRLLEVLEVEKEANVSELCALTGEPQPKISQQLSRLRLEGVLATRREGNQVFYRMARPEVLGVLDCIRRMGRTGRKQQ
jgi:ArsR family transcriptional regulator